MAIPWEDTITTIGIAGGAGGTLLLMEPNAVNSKPNALALRGGVVETPNGARVVDKDPALPTARHEFEFACVNRAERQFLEAFFDARQGRAEPFWFPTWQWELELRGYTWVSVDGLAWVKRWQDKSYASHFAASTEFRKLIVLRGTDYKVHTVTAVTQNVATGVDLLTLKNNNDSLLITPMGAGPTRVDDSYRPLWLRYGRFDQDEIVVEELQGAMGDGAALVRVAMVELPDSVPVTG